jgi:hypothetical protein
MNAREEFEKHTSSNRGKGVKCAMIVLGDEYDEDRATYYLPLNYSGTLYAEFLQQINKTYDSGYGGQRLFGTIWYEDGSWSDRGEYDGSEWWEYQTCPAIPKELL